MRDGVLSPKSDFVFKLLFGDQRNADVLAAFLTAILGLPEDEFAEVTIIDPHLKPEDLMDKWGVLDVKVRTKTGKIIDIEIQVDEHGDLEARVIFYSAKMVTEQIQRGYDYETIKKTVSIIITDFVRFEKSPAYHHRFTLYDKEHAVEFTDLVEVHVLELPKLPEQSDGSPQWKWLQFLKTEKRNEFNELAKEDKMLTKVVGKLMELSEDELTHLREEYYEKWRRDQVSRDKWVLQKGLAEGRAEGEKKAEPKAKQRPSIKWSKNGGQRDAPMPKLPNCWNCPLTISQELDNTSTANRSKRKTRNSERISDGNYQDHSNCRT